MRRKLSRLGTIKITTFLCLVVMVAFPFIALAQEEVFCPDGEYMTAEQRALMNSGAGYYDLCSLERPEGTVDDGGGTTGPLVGCDTAEQIYNFFRAKTDPASGQPAFEDYMIAAIIGNFMAEAGPDLIPTTTNGIGAYGLAQWLGGRKANLQSKPGYETVQVQLDFTWEELMGPENRSYNALRAAGDVNTASDEWEDKFERSGGELLPERRSYSRGILNQISTGEWCTD